MSDELKKLANVPVEHSFCGRVFKLTPMKLLAAHRAQEIVEPFVAELADGKVNLTRLMMRHAVRLHEVVLVMLAGADDGAIRDLRGWFAAQDDTPDYEALLAALIEVNADFFARRVQQIAMETLRAQISGPSAPPGTSPTTETAASPAPDGLMP